MKFIILASLLLLSPYAHGQTITMGETNVLPTIDDGNGNFLAAQSATLAQSATVGSMSFYIRVAGGNLRLGIYDATGPNGGAGKLLTQSAETAVTGTGWITLAVQPVLLSPGMYWLAYLPSSNILGFWVDRTSGSELARPQTYGALPATFGTPSEATPVHWSLYATLQVTPTPTPTPTPTQTPPMPKQATLAWSPPATVTGYKLLWGTTKGGPYPNVIDVKLPAPLQYTLTVPASGTYYAVTESYDANGLVSCYSNETTFTVP